jgi:hypothetical protein
MLPSKRQQRFIIQSTAEVLLDAFYGVHPNSVEELVPHIERAIEAKKFAYIEATPETSRAAHQSILALRRQMAAGRQLVVDKVVGQ